MGSQERNTEQLSLFERLAGGGVVWGLILLFCWGFSFALGHGVSFFRGIQHSPVDDCSVASGNFGVLTGEDERVSFYFAILRAKTHYTHTHTHTHICIHRLIYICIHRHIYIHTQVYIYIGLCIYMWQPTTVFLPGESLGQRSLVSYSP